MAFLQLLTCCQSDEVSTISPLAANHAMASTTQHAGQFPKLRSYCRPLAGSRRRQYLHLLNMFQYLSLHRKPAWTIQISFHRGLQDQMCWDVLVRPDTPSLPNSSHVCHVPRVALIKSSMFAWVKVLARSGPAWNSMLPQHATDWDAADSQAEIWIPVTNLRCCHHGKTWQVGRCLAFTTAYPPPGPGSKWYDGSKESKMTR